MPSEVNEDIAQVEVTDNSIDTDIQEPEISDNSDSEVQEPENKTNDNEQGNELKAKFKTLDEAINAHSALEKKLGENSKELGELRKQKEEMEKFKENQLKFVQKHGFNTVEEFEEYQLEEQYNKDLANFEADEYLRHIDEVQDPDEMKKVLLKYRQNPNKEILDFIEAEFPMDTIKNVAGKIELQKGQLQNAKLEAQKEQFMNSAKEYLDMNVNKYSENFKNSAFAELYSEAFKALGTDLDTDFFISLLNKYTDSIIKNANLQKGMQKENEEATDELAGLSVGQTQNLTEKPLTAMSQKELNSYIKRFV